MMPNTSVGWGQSRRPPIPPVTDEAGVVNWFLLYDEKIADFRRNFPSKINEARHEFIADLQQNGTTAVSLKTQLQKISTFYSEVVLPQAGLRTQHGGPLPNETREDYREVMFLEAALAAKMRIFGYVLLKKYGIQPE